MKLLKHIIPLLLLFILNSCLGDKKMINVSEIGDASFVNKNFKGNGIDFTKEMSACDKLNAAVIAKIYNVGVDVVHVEDPTKSNLYRKDISPVCVFYIKKGNTDFEWLRGSIAIKKEVGKEDIMSDIAEAVGDGENWEEAWSIKKATSKSAEWIPNMGKAALWNERKTLLEIKMDGYNISIHPLKNILNKVEVAKNRDYKNIAIQMAKESGFLK